MVIFKKVLTQCILLLKKQMNIVQSSYSTREWGRVITRQGKQCLHVEELQFQDCFN